MEKLTCWKVLIIFGVCVVMSSLISSQGCGKYCICSLERTDCYFSHDNEGMCMGEVPLMETYVLNIYGPVCENARRLLKENTFHNTIKVLHNDVCGAIPGCR